MSSLARRSLRTTAAAAGIAALGVGLAGHALAAVEPPTVTGVGDVPISPALPPASTMPPAEGLQVLDMDVQAPESPLPAGEAFAVPAAAPALPAPALPAPALPSPQAVPTPPAVSTLSAMVPGVTPGEGLVNGWSVEATGSDNALASMDGAAFAQEMAQTAAEALPFG